MSLLLISFSPSPTGIGYLKTEDLRRILVALGRALPTRTIKELLSNVVDAGSRHRGERVYYREITDKEVKDEE